MTRQNLAAVRARKELKDAVRQKRVKKHSSQPDTHDADPKHFCVLRSVAHKRRALQKKMRSTVETRRGSSITLDEAD
eukprot:6182323-Pleurochrysis_carterae.AAC.1